LVVVLVVLVALAAIVVPMVSGRAQDAQKTATNATLIELRNVILASYRPDMSSRLPRPGDTGLKTRQDKPQLRYLFANPGPLTDSVSGLVFNAGASTATETTSPTYDPILKLGWRGPYLMTSTGTYPDPDAAGAVFTHAYGEKGDPTVLDGWLRPIVILESSDSLGKHAELRSAGPDGLLNTSDDLVVSLY
jgi:hypothetical protein